MSKRPASSNNKKDADDESRADKRARVVSDRLDPRKRGIHKDGVKAERAPTGRSKCVDCGKVIPKGALRWGIKYAGNPLSEPVIPLYGSHPMYMWCHAGGCGLSYCRIDNSSSTTLSSEASRTCHLCCTEPDEQDKGLRLLCGGGLKGTKVLHHAFHLQCWRDCVEMIKDPHRSELLVSPSAIERKGGRGVGWKDLTAEEKTIATQALA